MSGVEDLQTLRLIRAFRKITDQDVRRLVVAYVEEQLGRNKSPGEPSTSSPADPR